MPDHGAVGSDRPELLIPLVEVRRAGHRRQLGLHRRAVVGMDRVEPSPVVGRQRGIVAVEARDRLVPGGHVGVRLVGPDAGVGRLQGQAQPGLAGLERVLGRLAGADVLDDGHGAGDPPGGVPHRMGVHPDPDGGAVGAEEPLLRRVEGRLTHHQAEEVGDVGTPVVGVRDGGHRQQEQLGLRPAGDRGVHLVHPQEPPARYVDQGHADAGVVEQGVELVLGRDRLTAGCHRGSSMRPAATAWSTASSRVWASSLAMARRR